MTTTLDLDELERLETAATPGPWTGVVYGENAGASLPPPYWMWLAGMCPLTVYVDRWFALSPEDGAYIAALRNGFPSLISRLRAAEAIIELTAKLPLSLESLVAVRVQAKEHVYQYRAPTGAEKS